MNEEKAEALDRFKRDLDEWRQRQAAKRRRAVQVIVDDDSNTIVLRYMRR